MINLNGILHFFLKIHIIASIRLAHWLEYAGENICLLANIEHSETVWHQACSSRKSELSIVIDSSDFLVLMGGWWVGQI